MSSVLITTFRGVNVDHAVLELIAKKIFIREEARKSASHVLIHSLSEETFQDKIQKIFGVAFPSPDVISKRYGVPLASKRLYLYYLKRPFDLIMKHRKIISEIPRVKDDVILNRWIHSQDTKL